MVLTSIFHVNDILITLYSQLPSNLHEGGLPCSFPKSFITPQRRLRQIAKIMTKGGNVEQKELYPIQDGKECHHL
jgi:hypothetical protein